MNAGKLWAGVMLALLAVALAAYADDEAAVESSQNPAEQFATAQTDWAKFEKDTARIRASFRTAQNDEERESLRKEYESVAAKAPGILKNLREGAVALYSEAPEKDPEVTKALARLINDDVRRDDYETALKLARPMIDHNTANKEVYNSAGVAAYGSDDFINAEKWLTIAKDAGKLDRAGQICLGDAAEAQARFSIEQKLREKEKKADNLPRVKLETNRGVIIVELFENEAPETVGNFVSLVEKGFYNGLTFHRVIGGFMAQGGDPNGVGSGGPGYQIYCECEKPLHREHFRGTLSMAHAGKDTGGSQFFLTFVPTTHLDGKHTVFGRVVDGMDVLAKIQRTEGIPGATPDKIIKATVISKRNHKYVPVTRPDAG